MIDGRVNAGTGLRSCSVASALRSSWVQFGLCVLLGIALRLPGLDPPVERFSTDFAHHLRSAEAILQGQIDWHLLMKGPGVAPFMALGFLVLGGSGYVEWFLWNTLVLFPAGAVALFALSRKMFQGTAWSVIPPLILALWPPQIVAVRLVAGENVVILATCLTAWAFVHALERPNFGRAALAGFCFGVGLLIKPLFLLLVPVAMAFFCIRWSERFPFASPELGSRGRNVLRSAVFTGVLVSTVAPWQTYSYEKLGRFTTIAAYGDLAFFLTNQPYGDSYYQIAHAFRRTIVPELESLGHYDGYDWRKLREYSLYYIRHDPMSVFRGLDVNIANTFGGINGMATWVFGKGREEYRNRELDEAFIGTIYIASILGFLSIVCAPGKMIDLTVRSLWFYGYIISLVIMLKGDVRHRMAFDGFSFLLATNYLRAVLTGSSDAWIRAPVAGLARFVSLCGEVVGRVASTMKRCPIYAGVVAAGVVVVVFMAAWPRDIRVDSNDYVGGTLEVLDRGEVAVPNSVIGLPAGDPGRSYNARFTVEVPETGMYELRSIYSAARRYPVELYIDGVIRKSDAFGEHFGGALNRFARNRIIGEFELEEGTHELELVGQEWSETNVVARYHLPHTEELYAILEPFVEEGSVTSHSVGNCSAPPG